MITEEAKESLAIEKLKKGIQLCDEAILKSEKYERLIDNPDFKGYLEDLRVLIAVHDREIQFGVAMLPDAPHNTYVKRKDDGSGKEQIVSGKLEWSDFISRHQIQKQELQNWIEEPQRILSMARDAREQLPVLKSKLAAYAAARNGAGD